MSKPHKWHKEIKAWADGAEIEFRYVEMATKWETFEDWQTFNNEEEWEYRIKPKSILLDEVENLLDEKDKFIENQLKPQPKEPQYLYVCYCPDTKEYSIGERGKTLQGRWINLGKIKLEDSE